MGHTAGVDREYQLLQRKLDAMVNGAPDSPVFMKILKLLYSPGEAELARRLPGKPSTLEEIARLVDMPADRLDGMLRDMAGRGVVLDYELGGVRYFSLPPVVLGFFEYTFMRTRDDLPMKQLAELFHQYMFEDDRFARAVFSGQTQPGRALVHEDVLGDHTEILDWERAGTLLVEASALGVSQCACRHKAEHLGTACDAPREVCLTLNHGAETMIKSGIARRIGVSEGLDILAMCREAGLMQTGDNVQRHVTYMCNCCGCCCGMIGAIRTFNINQAIVSSNWIMQVDEETRGCGLCVAACPVEAISLVEEDGRRTVRVEEDLCLGCGVCVRSCGPQALSMVPRPQRVYTPESVFDKTIAMAIERGKLADLLTGERDALSFRALGRIIACVEHSAPFRSAMAVESLKSSFLNLVVAGARASYGDIGRILS